MVTSKQRKSDNSRKKLVSKNTKKGSEKKNKAKRQENNVKDNNYGQIPEAYVNDLGLFSKALTAHPAIINQVREIFEDRLAEKIDRKTFPRIVNAMSMLLGSKITMVIMTGCHFDSPEFFEDLLNITKDNDKVKGAIHEIQHLASIYGDRIQMAYTLSSGTLDEDWHSLDINTFKREGDSPVWFINMLISLYNGEEIKMKMTPNSAFQFIDIIIRELNESIPMDQVDSDLVERCRDDINSFRRIYYHKCGDGDDDDGDHPEGYA